VKRHITLPTTCVVLKAVPTQACPRQAQVSDALPICAWVVPVPESHIVLVTTENPPFVLDSTLGRPSWLESIVVDPLAVLVKHKSRFGLLLLVRVNNHPWKLRTR
jgi:hypothetical protein